MTDHHCSTLSINDEWIAIVIDGDMLAARFDEAGISQVLIGDYGSNHSPSSARRGSDGWPKATGLLRRAIIDHARLAGGPLQALRTARALEGCPAGREDLLREHLQMLAAMSVGYED